jgi:hypothetical protein
VLWLGGLSVVAVVGLVAFLGLVARHSARTADTPREANALQAINAALIDERNQMEKRVKELERAEAMHHKAMLSKTQEMDDAIEAVIAQTVRASQAEERVEELETKLTEKTDLVMDKVIAIGAWFHENPAPGVAATRAYLRQQGIEVTNPGYKKLSAFVQSLAPLPHHEASPVRDAATEKKPANARRERTRTRSRTQARTQKARR